MHPDWARSLRDQCEAAAVPFFFKQWGNIVPEGQCPGGDDMPRHCRDWFKRDGVIFYRTTKEASGCLLDGVEHKAMPEARG